MSKVSALLAGEGWLPAPSVAALHATIARYGTDPTRFTDAQRELLRVFFSLVVPVERCEWSVDGESIFLALKPAEIAACLNKSVAQIAAWRRMFPRTNETLHAIAALSAAIRSGPVFLHANAPVRGWALQRAKMASLRNVLAHSQYAASREKHQKQYARLTTQADVTEPSAIQGYADSLGSAPNVPSVPSAPSAPSALEEARVLIRQRASKASIVPHVIPQVLTALAAAGEIERATESSLRKGLRRVTGRHAFSQKQITLLRSFLLLVAPGNICDWRVNGKRFRCCIDLCDVAGYLKLSEAVLRYHFRRGAEMFASGLAMEEKLGVIRLFAFDAGQAQGGFSGDAAARLAVHPNLHGMDALCDAQPLACQAVPDSNDVDSRASNYAGETLLPTVAGPSWSSEAMSFLRSHPCQLNRGSC